MTSERSPSPTDEVDRSGSAVAAPPASLPWTDRLAPAASVRGVLAEHSDKILVLPAGRRIPIAALLGHLETCQRASCPHEWAGLACEVGFEEWIDPAAIDAPWSAPEAAPCWRRPRVPLFHLWVTRGPSQPRTLLGLIIPDQRFPPDVSEIVQLLDQGDPVSLGNRPAAPGPERSFEARLSDLVVESAACPPLPPTNPSLAAHWKPAGKVGRASGGSWGSGTSGSMGGGAGSKADCHLAVWTAGRPAKARSPWSADVSPFRLSPANLLPLH